MTMTDFLNDRPDLTMKATRIKERADEWARGDHEKYWSKDARHFSCLIKYGRRTMTVEFSQGSAHKVDPTLSDVLDCLASDIDGLTGGSFRDWCHEYGYDEDSRRAERMYRAICEQDKDIKYLMGGDYMILRHEVERL